MTFRNQFEVLWIILFAMILLFDQAAEATERDVCPSGCVYSAIQDAVDASDSGDSIVVHGGTYIENLTIGRSLTIRSLPGPAEAFIVAASRKPCVSFAGVQTSVLDGFSIQGGLAGPYVPSGIYIGPEVTAATVSNCVVTGNAGAGLYNDSGGLVLRDSIITDHRPGPGLLLGGDDNLVEKSVIAGNENNGIVLQRDSNLTMVNSFVTGNFAARGGGIAVGSHSSLHITNSTIAGNRGGDMIDNRGGGILLYGFNKVGIVNSIIWGNYPYSIQRQSDSDMIGVQYSDLQDFTFLYKKAAGEGVIRARPYFVSPLSAAAAPSSGGDYHLTGDSPCRDRGTGAQAIYPLPDDDIDGQLRPQGAGYDMGADEFFLGQAVTPLPDIAVNSSDAPTVVARHLNQPVYAAIGLNPGASADLNADWWIIVEPPFPYPIFSIIFDGRKWKEGVTVSKHDVLEHLNPRLVFYQKSSRLPVGRYTFYFGIDMAMNGKLDRKMLIFDAARLEVAP